MGANEASPRGSAAQGVGPSARSAASRSSSAFAACFSRYSRFISSHTRVLSCTSSASLIR